MKMLLDGLALWQELHVDAAVMSKSVSCLSLISDLDRLALFGLFH